jgi:hypothetical protein
MSAYLVPFEGYLDLWDNFLSDHFAEILPRFISKPTLHKAHKRIFSDRDPLFYWRYA